MHSRRVVSQRLLLLLISWATVVQYVKSEPAVKTPGAEVTLVVYSYRHADPEALGNLQHFVDTVMSPQDPARYIIVVDQAMQQHGHMSSHGLPALPSNAEYLSIRDCFELGHVGKVLLGEKSSVHVNMEQYNYFVWLDSSAKGPLLPGHTLQGDYAPAWHTLLTSRITTATKLVGANIVCEPVNEDFVPHVEASLMATDTAGLLVLQKAKCFDCYATWHEAKMKGEVAASAAMLDAGYNLDCLSAAHQGVNWRDKSAWPCAKTVRQHPQEAANMALESHVEKFRSRGGQSSEAQVNEVFDETLEEEAQLQHGIHDEQRVSDSLLEAGFVKPLQHEDPDADQEQTARIGGRLVESGFGRLQFEDAMEHSRQTSAEGLLDADSIEGAEGLISEDDMTQLEGTQGQHSAQHAGGTHDTQVDLVDPEHAERSAEDVHTAANAHAAITHMTDFEDVPEDPLETAVTVSGDDSLPVHVSKTNVAEADEAVDLRHPDKTDMADLEEGMLSELCPNLKSEPAPRRGLHLQNEAVQLAAEVAELDHAEGVDIAFYGDSITEMWKNGVPSTGGRSNVFWDNFGAYTSAILAVGGDQTANLWWRVLHGEVFEQHPPQLSIVLIGINDLGTAATCGASFVTSAAHGVAQRITSMVSHLQHVNPDSNVLLVGILPCAAESTPGPDGTYPWPNGLSPGIAHVNKALEEFALQHNLVHYVDCADDMLIGDQISESVMPDGVHPSAVGMARLASCLSPSVFRYAQPRQDTKA